jgi:hypothetical protein
VSALDLKLRPTTQQQTQTLVFKLDINVNLNIIKMLQESQSETVTTASYMDLRGRTACCRAEIGIEHRSWSYCKCVCEEDARGSQGRRLYLASV